MVRFNASIEVKCKYILIIFQIIFVSIKSKISLYKRSTFIISINFNKSYFWLFFALFQIWIQSSHNFLWLHLLRFVCCTLWNVIIVIYVNHETFSRIFSLKNIHFTINRASASYLFLAIHSSFPIFVTENSIVIIIFFIYYGLRVFKHAEM